MSYRKKHIKNKIHKIRPKKSVLRRPIFWIFILFLTIFFTVSYFLLFFSVFQIQSIVISGNEIVQSKDIESLVSTNVNRKIISIGKWSVTSKSIFLTNPPELQQIILKTFPTIETVTIERRLPQSVNLKIEERKPIAIFCQTDQNEGCFFIDKNGVIFEDLKNHPQDKTTIKQSPGNKAVFVGENVIEKNTMNIISKVKKNLKDNFRIDVKEALLTSPLRLDIKTNENWQIYFNLNSDTDLQIAKLNSLLRDEISQSGRANIQYIDLRFKDRAYYR